LVVFDLFGNDVCYKEPYKATSPEDFYKDIMYNWEYLDSVLPPGSHMLVLGLIKGNLIYDTVKD